MHCCVKGLLRSPEIITHGPYKPWAYMYFRGWAYTIEKWDAYRLILIFSPGLVCQVLRGDLITIFYEKLLLKLKQEQQVND
ncbi:hypothetical protein BpHYR1_017373 [Brachionus plicatilis]|uniref:Uncharacterized protein n=1 Tax=Brachionus plicatilis TaxID=10195 RepID=A0A3M7QUV3_BRAPC|nr:hypothetical protein BpHYR1_017373 [Brachionus plicatilis]